jgi:Peptidase family C25
MRESISVCCDLAAPGSTLTLTYTDRHGRETHKKVPLRRGEAHAIETQARNGAHLRRMRVFSREASLVYDESFVRDRDWPAEHKFAVRASAPLRGMHPHEDNPFRRRLTRRGAVSIERRAGAHLPRIEGLPNGGKPGQPSLPVEVHRILIPPSVRVTAVRAIETAPPVRIAARHPALVPPAVKDTPNRQYRAPRRIDAPRTPPMTGRFPRELAHLERIETFDWGSIATVQLWPVRYDFGHREFVHHPDLAFELVADLVETPGAVLFPNVSGPIQARILLSLLRDPALNYSVLDAAGIADTSPRDLTIMFDPAIFLLIEPCPFVIITDDVTWSGNSSPNPPFLSAPPNIIEGAPPLITPGPAVPVDAGSNGPISHFERLAQWKTSRGVRTKVMSVSSIAETYDRTTDLDSYLPPDGALDLPEIIRAFVLYAHDAWKTQFVLLGGDINIVPTRQVSAVDGPHIPPNKVNVIPGTNVPGMPQGTTPFIAQLSADTSIVGSLDEADTPIDASWSLVALSSGTVYRPGTGNPSFNSWYFAQPNFAANNAPGVSPTAGNAAATPLNVVVYGGPELATENIGFAWLWPGATSETDHYYSDMTRAPDGRHDFDANGNMVLGQFVPQQSGSPDNVQSQGSVHVGRAPVTSGEDARNFVDKVMCYETQQKIRAPLDLADLATLTLAGEEAKNFAGQVMSFETRQGNGAKYNPSYLSRLTLLASKWIAPWGLDQHPSADPTSPQAGEFWPDAMNTADLLVWAEADSIGNALGEQQVTQPAYSLYAVRAGDEQLIPYDATGMMSTCWYFCSDLTFQTPATGWGTPYIRVRNAPACDAFFWQSAVEDLASIQKDRIFATFQDYFAAFGNPQRYYADSTNAAFAGRDVQQLLSETFSQVVNAGSHFISASGHGNFYYISGYTDSIVSTSDAVKIKNNNMPFIMFAHSCLTAEPTQASLGQFLVNRPNGAGAVGYVGFSHSCFIDAAAPYEQGFWTSLYQTGQLGPAVSIHQNASGTQDFSQLFMMMLYGDPEMSVWVRPPAAMNVSVTFQSGDSEIAVTATDAAYGFPIPGINVTALQGWTNSLTDPQLFLTTSTDENGRATVTVDATAPGRIVISQPGWYVPQIRDFDPTTGGVVAGLPPFYDTD